MECDDQTYSQTVIWVMWFNQNILKPMPISGTCNGSATPQPSLTISQSSNSPVTAGQNVTFTDTVQNVGNANATHVSLSESMPGNASFVSATASTGSCSQGSTVTCSLGTFTPGETETVHVTFTTLGPGTVTSGAGVSSDQTSTVSDSHAATVIAASGVTYATVNDSGITPAAPSPALGSDMRFVIQGTTAHSIADASGFSLFSSGPLTPPTAYDYAYTVAGAFQATDSTTGATTMVQVTPANPANALELVPFSVPWATQPLPSGMVEDVQVLPPGTTTWVSWVKGGTGTSALYLPVQTGDYRFRARLRNPVSGFNTPFSIGNTTTVGPAPPPALTVTQGSNTPVTAGQTLTFTDTVQNTGSSTQTGVSLTETLPGNAAFGSATPSTGSCTTGTSITCSLGTLAAGSSATVSVTFTTLGPGTVSSPVSVSSDQGGTASDNQPATVNPAPGYTYETVNDSGITPLTPSVPYGSPMRFLIQGTAAHSIADSTGFNLFSSGPLAPPAAYDYTYTAAGGYAVTDSTTGATTTVEVPTTNLANASATVPFTVPWANLAPPSGDVEDVQVLTPGASSWADFVVGSSDTSAPYTALQTGTYQFRARLRNATSGTATDWSAPASTVVGAAPPPVVSVSQSSNTPVMAGQSVTFTDTVQNAGTGVQTGVTLTESLPGNAAFSMATASAGTCTRTTSVVCSLGTLAPGTSATVSVTFTTFGPGTVASPASVSSDQGATGSNSAPATVTAAPGYVYETVADSGITPSVPKIGFGSTMRFLIQGTTAHSIAETSLSLFSSGPLSPPASFDYTFTAAGGFPVVDSTTAATNTIQVLTGNPATGSATVPFQVPWATQAPPAGYAEDVQVMYPGASTWTTLLWGSTGTSLVFTPSDAGTYKFHARLRNLGTGAYSQWSFPSSTVVGAAPPPSMTVVQGSNTPVVAGQSLTFTDTVQNAGSGGQTGVTVTEGLPGNAAFVSATASTGSCATATSVVCSLGALAPGASAKVTVTFTTLGPGSVSSPVSISSDQGATGSDNEPATVTAAPGYVYETVSDTGISPAVPKIGFGTTMRFLIQGTASHSIADASPLALFSSGTLVPPSSFDYAFTAAGGYPVVDSTTGATTTIWVLTGNPATGSVGVPLSVSWATQFPPPGWGEDVQVMPPGASTWTTLAWGTSTTSLSYTPSTAGTYKFHARLRNLNTGQYSQYNFPSATTVN
jgi:uncharacterized repeat protein (TIGR01451 family)